MDIGAGTMVYPDSVLYAVLVFMMLIFAFVGYQGYKVEAQTASHIPRWPQRNIHSSHKRWFSLDHGLENVIRF